jgi:hypothetical protein
VRNDWRQRRKGDVQLNLSLLEVPGPSHRVWESLDNEQRQDVTDKVARLLGRAALLIESNPEDAEDNSD